MKNRPRQRFQEYLIHRASRLTAEELPLFLSSFISIQLTSVVPSMAVWIYLNIIPPLKPLGPLQFTLLMLVNQYWYFKKERKTQSTRSTASSPHCVWVTSTWSPESWITAELNFRYVSFTALINQGWVAPGGLTGPLSICTDGPAWTGLVLVACYLLQIAKAVMGSRNGG